MGVYINGMELPDKNHLVLVEIDSNGDVFAAYDGGRTKLVQYKAVPVPPHGDLIDRYDLKNKEITFDHDEWNDTFHDGLLFVTNLIDNAPTTIPASEES